MNSIYQILLNVIGGAITVALIELGRYCWVKYTQYKFKGVFGSDILSSGNLHLVYGQLGLGQIFRPNGTINTHPYIKPGEENSGIGFSIERPVSSCELRAAKYLAGIIGREVKRSPILSSDFEVQGRIDTSFISFGGPASNHKTRDVLHNDSNIFFDFDNIQPFVTRQSRRSILIPEAGFDYGLILKIHPSQFSERTWLICAGLGEWGTSGAAWYLAYKWRKIYNFAKSESFAIIVKVRSGQDESAEPLISVKNRGDVERLQVVN